MSVTSAMWRSARSFQVEVPIELVCERDREVGSQILETVVLPRLSKRCSMRCACSASNANTSAFAFSSFVLQDYILDMQPQSKIQWFSILNSLVIVLFLTGMIGLILLRTLRRDIARYNQLDNSVRSADHRFLQRQSRKLE